ncbi:hypothetical protein [Aquimarina algicola]|uniref:Uncharacterized protein n=1 Tax=Aquimarina algicola TaxID=2589995 RepID=A0A504JEG6_9FLAO|nr:hypothetical protein [Aquimarina algicola]TPN85259.1 hypothetical protein FHK87_14640 [Aquimarina algicola]
MKILSEKISNILVIFNFIIVVVIGGIWVIHHFSSKKQKEQELLHAKTNLIEELGNNYYNLKNIAPVWNNLYAKLTLNKERDTSDYKRYTIKQFESSGRNHVINTLNNFKNENWKFYNTKIIENYSTSYEIKELIHLYQNQNNVKNYAQELLKIHHTIINTNQKKDSIAEYDKRYYLYFQYLRKIDQTLLDMSYQYESVLKYLINSSDILKNKAQQQLLNAKYYNFTNQNTTTIAATAQILKQCFDQSDSKDIVTETIKYYVDLNTKNVDHKLLVMVDISDSSNIIATTQSRRDILNKIYDCVIHLGLENVNEYYVCIKIGDYDHLIKTPNYQSIATMHNNENLYHLIPFFGDQVLEEFDINKIWYPKE